MDKMNRMDFEEATTTQQVRGVVRPDAQPAVCNAGLPSPAHQGPGSDTRSWPAAQAVPRRYSSPTEAFSRALASWPRTQ